MRIDDTAGTVDERWRGVLVVCNATPWLVRQGLPFDVAGYELHPVQSSGSDPLVRSCVVGTGWVTVPERTVAVFVHPR